MKTLKELRQLRAQKATRGKAALQEFNTLSAKAEADLTAAETAELEKLETELQAIETELPELDKAIVQAEATQRRSSLFAAPSASALSLARSFDPDPVLQGGFKSLPHFASAVMGAITGSPLSLEAAASGYMQNSGAAGEGYLVPPEYAQRVWDLSFDEPDLWAFARPEPTQSNTVLKPKDETTPWGAVGVQAAWRAEAAQMVTSKLALGGEIMQLHELYAFCAASSELLADAPMLNDRLTVKAGAAISWKASDAVMWGDGAGQPTGFMTAPALINQAAEGGQAAATILIANLGKMLSRVLRVGGKPIWIANPDTLPQLISLQVGNYPAYIPINQGAQANPFDGYILGYPVIFTEHGQTLGTSGDLVCANMAGYYAANKSAGVDFASSIHLWFDQNLIAFRWTFRLNGQPYLSKPVAAARGAATKSHFVSLANR